MPARRDLTVEDIREQNRLRKQKQRAASRDVSRDTQQPRHVTPHKKEARHVTPPQTPPTGETFTMGEGRGVAAILAPFESRGYRHDVRFWAKMAQTFPAIDLELEAMKLADWLEEPVNRKERCSTRRIANWLKRAEADRQNPSRPTNGHTGNGIVHQPNSLNHNRQPDAPRLLKDELVPYDRNDYREFQTERRKLTLPERVAQYKGVAK